MIGGVLLGAVITQPVSQQAAQFTAASSVRLVNFTTNKTNKFDSFSSRVLVKLKKKKKNATKKKKKKIFYLNFFLLIKKKVTKKKKN